MLNATRHPLNRLFECFCEDIMQIRSYGLRVFEPLVTVQLQIDNIFQGYVFLTKIYYNIFTEILILLSVANCLWKFARKELGHAVTNFCL